MIFDTRLAGADGPATLARGARLGAASLPVLLAVALGAIGCARAPLDKFEPDEFEAKAALGDLDRQCAEATVEEVLRSLPDEGWGSFPETKLPRHPPLQTFPRLTAPAFIGFRDACPGQWFVPVLFEPAIDTVRPEKGAPTTFAEASPSLALRYWLEPATGDGSPESLVRVNRIFDLGVKAGPGATRQSHAVVLVLDDESVDPGFYWIRIAPRIHPRRTPSTPLERLVAAGDVPGILQLLKTDPPPGPTPGFAKLFECNSAFLTGGLNHCSHPIKHFWPEMREISKRARGGNAQKFLQAMRALYEDDHSPAGVVLDGRKPDDRPRTFSFVIGADTQHSLDMSAFRRFLEAASGRWRYERARKETMGALQEALTKWDPENCKLGCNEIEFVLIAGDLADAHASSDLARMLINVFGLWPPIPTYAEEYPTLAREIRRFPKPFVAVPGNHDGMVGYPGLLNFALGWLRRTDFLNDYIPVFFKPPYPSFFPWLMEPLFKWPDVRPRYDGLAEWRYYLGPTSYAFELHGHTFAGLNSFHLNQRERSGTGSVIFNWGGGVLASDVTWLGDVLERLERTEDGVIPRQFLFMHHDPRGATPLKKTLDIDRYGIYDEIDNWASFLSWGHFGLGHSPEWDFFLPMVTPVVHHATRLLDDWLSARGRQQEEWMRRETNLPWHAEDASQGYGAKPLIDKINAHLYQDERGGISHIFFGHNDVPLGAEPWVHARDNRKVFIELPRGDWNEGREYHWWFARPRLPFKYPLSYVMKFRNDEPPDWARNMRVDGGRNADVIRLDDIANPGGKHGFHLVTVVPACDQGEPGPCETQVHPVWIELPSERLP